MSVSLENEKNCGNTSKLQEVCRPTVGRLTADRLPTVGRQSTDKIVWEPVLHFYPNFHDFSYNTYRNTDFFFHYFRGYCEKKKGKKLLYFNYQNEECSLRGPLLRQHPVLVPCFHSVTVLVLTRAFLNTVSVL